MSQDSSEKSFGPGEISLDSSGSPFSRDFDDVYASRDGAYEQFKYVFLGGNGLPKRWANKDKFTVLENGFGLGVNFLATWKAWQEDPNRPEKLFFISIEKFPLERGKLETYCPEDLKPLAQQLKAKWPPIVPGVHELTFEDGRVVLRLYFMDTERAVKRLSGSFDALYLDGFSPKKNPQMWEPKLIKNISKHANPEATAATWCVASAVRRALFESGFEVEKVKGFGHKSQMTVARYCPKFKHPRHIIGSSGGKKVSSAIVIGAGLAGAAVCEKLAQSGVEVSVVQSGAIAASDASAIRWALAHSQWSADDNLLFRLTRAGKEFLVKALQEYPDFYQFEGLFQMARDEKEWSRWKQSFAVGKPFKMPADYMSLADSVKAKDCVGLEPRLSGLWHSSAGIVRAAEWVRERIGRNAKAVYSNTAVETLRKTNGVWEALDKNGTVIASADSAVICAAYDSLRLSGMSLPLTRWKGRLSLIYSEDIAKLKNAVTGPGYIINSPDGWMAAGATYEEGDSPMTVDQAHGHNQALLESIFPNAEKSIMAGFYAGYRCVTTDRLPVVGRVAPSSLHPDTENLFMSAAFGSRGLVLSDLAARIIASQVLNEPAPVESDLIKALDPKRFN